MRFDRSSYSSRATKPRTAVASLIAGAIAAMFLSFAPQEGHLPDSFAPTSSSSALRNSTPGSAPASNVPAVLEPALRNIEGVTYPG